MLDVVRNRIEMQSGHLDEIAQRFPGQVRAGLPRFDSDIRGVPSISRVERGCLRLIAVRPRRAGGACPALTIGVCVQVREVALGEDEAGGGMHHSAPVRDQSSR